MPIFSALSRLRSRKVPLASRVRSVEDSTLYKASAERAMAKLVFDIETSALPLENFDEAQQDYLFRDADKLTEDTEREARRTEILNSLTSAVNRPSRVHRDG